MNLKGINNNADDKLIESENINRYEKNEFTYTEEDIKVKLESLHLSNNQGKNKAFYNYFEDEDLIMKNIKNKKVYSFSQL